MTSVQCLTHPLAKEKVGRLRDRNTSTAEFRRLVYELSLLLTVFCTEDLHTSSSSVETPITTTTADFVSDNIVLAPVLRAGLGMVDGMLQLIPDAKVGHIGFYRDEQTLLPVEYYVNLPSVEQSVVFVLDPMLATGGTATAALSLLKSRGVSKLRLVSLIAAPEGIRKVQVDHPDVAIFTAAIDESLNEKGYIVPGLGDAGDRIFGTHK